MQKYSVYLPPEIIASILVYVGEVKDFFSFMSIRKDHLEIIIHEYIIKAITNIIFIPISIPTNPVLFVGTIYIRDGRFDIITITSLFLTFPNLSSLDLSYNSIGDEGTRGR